MNDRHTITINENAYFKLRDIGRFGESYSDVILRLIDAAPKYGCGIGPADEGGDKAD
jgi:predicted CopG family antitoxin